MTAQIDIAQKDVAQNSNPAAGEDNSPKSTPITSPAEEAASTNSSVST